MPGPVPLDPDASTYTIDKGQPGDLCSPCAKQPLANLGHWQGHGKQQFPKELLSLCLFKCRQQWIPNGADMICALRTLWFNGQWNAYWNTGLTCLCVLAG
jgi:hypothetical protein